MLALNVADFRTLHDLMILFVNQSNENPHHDPISISSDQFHKYLHLINKLMLTN